MEILQSINELSKYLSGVIFTHSSIWFALEEAMGRTAGNIFEHQYNLFFSFDGFIESSNVRMIEPLHKSDFSSDRFLPLDVLNLLFFIYLEGHFFIQLFMHTNSDNGVCSLPYLLSDYVVAQTVLVRKYYFIRCGSRLLFGNLLVVLIILSLRRPFLVIPRFNRLCTRRTQGLRCRLGSCHLLRIFGAHAGRLFGSTYAISIGGRLRCSNFRLEERALWMRLWRLKAMLHLIALSVFALVFVEVKWFSDRLGSSLGRLRMMRSKLNRMWHGHIWVIRSLDLKLLIQARLLRSLIGLLTTHNPVSWTTSCSPDISWLLIGRYALRCISSIIQMFDAVSWWRRLEKEVILHLLTPHGFVALNISLCKTASILNCWPGINGSVRLLILLHSLILVVVQFLLVCVCPVLISKHFWKSTLALSFISRGIVGPRYHHGALLILLLLALLVFFHAHGYILNMGSSSINMLRIITDDHLFMVRRTWLHHSPHWTHTSHGDRALSARSLMVKFLIGRQLISFWRLLWLAIAERNVDSVHYLLLLGFL